MITLKILCLFLLAWPAFSTPLKAPAPPSRSPVYFPITPEEFEAYGIRLSQSARRSSSNSLRGDVGELPSTTPKPTTTTMRLPIAQESHGAPSELITESPGVAYLTNSNYYIPGRLTEPSRSGVDQQDISGNPRYEDDDRGNSFIEPSYRSRSRGRQQGGDEEDTPRYSVIGPDTSPQDQERFGVFFIGEHESFGGSEEHFEEVPFGSLYIPPNSEEDIVSSLQTLPAAQSSSLTYGSKVSVEVPDGPIYEAPRSPSSSYESPDQSIEEQYLPSTTTQAPYQPPSTSVRYYTPPTTPATYYVPSTTSERSYLPPSTTERRYRAPAKESSEEVSVVVTTPRYSKPRISLSTRYGPPVTTEKIYVQSRVTSAPRRYTTPTTTTEKPYSPPRSYNPPSTTTEKPYSPPRRYNPPSTTTEKPYSPRRRYKPTTTTTERAYTRPRTSAPRRYTIPSTTTERTYGVPKLVSVRKYTGSPPTTTTITERSYTKKSSSSRSRSRARARYTPPSTTTTTTAAPVRYRRPTTTTEKPSHSLYFKASSEEGKSRKATPSRQRASYKSREKNESSRRTYSRQPAVIKPVYSAPTNLTIKSISVATSSSVASSAPAERYTGARSKPSRSRSSSRTSSTYKSPFSSAENEEEIKSLGPSASRSSDSRAGSKYQFPVYRTSDKSFRAPSSLYQIRDSSKTTAVSQPDFVQAGDNIYIPQEYDESSIPGDAGVDYPVLREVPDTSFSCEAQEHPGLYADTEADCQVFHICQKAGRHDSFLCPNGTVFNQQYFVCDWWYNFACDSAKSFFGLNEFIYELPEEEQDYRRSK